MGPDDWEQVLANGPIFILVGARWVTETIGRPEILRLWIVSTILLFTRLLTLLILYFILVLLALFVSSVWVVGVPDGTPVSIIERDSGASTTDKPSSTRIATRGTANQLIWAYPFGRTVVIHTKGYDDLHRPTRILSRVTVNRSELTISPTVIALIPDKYFIYLDGYRLVVTINTNSPIIENTKNVAGTITGAFGLGRRDTDDCPTYFLSQPEWATPVWLREGTIAVSDNVEFRLEDGSSVVASKKLEVDEGCEVTLLVPK